MVDAKITNRNLDRCSIEVVADDEAISAALDYLKVNGYILRRNRAGMPGHIVLEGERTLRSEVFLYDLEVPTKA